MQAFSNWDYITCLRYPAVSKRATCLWKLAAMEWSHDTYRERQTRKNALFFFLQAYSVLFELYSKGAYWPLGPIHIALVMSRLVPRPWCAMLLALRWITSKPKPIPFGGDSLAAPLGKGHFKMFTQPLIAVSALLHLLHRYWLRKITCFSRR